MTGMSMPQTWYGAAAGYLGMWLAMMVPMMTPSLVPMLSRYRRSVRGAHGIHRHGLTALVCGGYFVVWAALGVWAYAAGSALTAIELRWEPDARWLLVAPGAVLLAAGALQLTAWKARRLALCRKETEDACLLPPDALAAWRHGLRLGMRCSLSCGNLMVMLLAIGMMDPMAMAAVTAAISAERLAPAPLRVARVSGWAIIAMGTLTIARI
jgi:predicted metal-binding membrane protein